MCKTDYRIAACARLSAALAMWVLLASAHAQSGLEITIDEGVEGAVPIAVVPFRYIEGAEETPMLTDIVRNDLARSAQFDVLDQANLAERPYDLSEVNEGVFRRLGVDWVATGTVKPAAGTEGGLSVELQLIDVKASQPTRVKHLSFPTRVTSLRYTAHHVADVIYEAVFGIPGAFRTRIAYVTASGPLNDRRYQLMVADSDGYNPQPVVRSREPLLSPSWSHDSRRLAYVSFEESKPVIFVQELATGSRTRIADFKGINGAPAFSPDDSKLAMALSRSGNLEIYVMDLATRDLTQVTRNLAIDTEPAWMPDGEEILFTSDRSGRPQIYKTSARGGDTRRVTFEGSENARATISWDGRLIATSHRREIGGQDEYVIAVLDTDTEAVRVITRNPLSESPSFAPNGSMVLFASKQAGKSVLSAVPTYGRAASSDGRVGQELVYADGDIQEPAWSPLRN